MNGSGSQEKRPRRAAAYCSGLSLLCALLSLAGARGLSQDTTLNDRPVARIGGWKAVSEKEFLARYEFSPGFERHNAVKKEENKKVFLASLLAEKILAARASEEGLASTPQYREAIARVERLLTRDELYQREVRAKLVLTDEEIRRGRAMLRTRLDVVLMFAATEGGASFLERQIRGGTKLENLVIAPGEDSLMSGPDSLVVRWGEGNPKVEEVCYALPLGGTSEPVAFDDGYYIFKVVRRSIGRVPGADDDLSERKKAEKVLRQRKEEEKTFDVMASFLRGKKAEVDRAAFRTVVVAILQTAAAHSSGTQKLFTLDLPALDALHRRLEATWDSPFVIFAKGSWTLGDALTRVRESGFGIAAPVEKNCRKALDDRLRGIIFQEELADEAFRQHLERSPEVAWKMSMWSDSFLASLLRNMIADSMSIALADIAEYSNNMVSDSPSVPLVAVEIVKFDSLSRARMFADSLDSGVSPAATAGREKWCTLIAGADRYWTEEELAGMRESVGRLPVGGRTQPMKFDGAYAIVILKDRRFVSRASKDPLVGHDISLRDKILAHRRQHAIDQRIGGLAAAFGVTIDRPLLASIHVTSIPAVFYQLLGFGGRMLAAPLIAPDVDWLLFTGDRPPLLP